MGNKVGRKERRAHPAAAGSKIAAAVALSCRTRRWTKELRRSIRKAIVRSDSRVVGERDVGRHEKGGGETQVVSEFLHCYNMPSGSVCRSMTRYPAYAEHSLEQMCRSTHGCSSNKAFAQHIRQATHARRAQRARNSACAQGDGHLKSRRRSCWPGNAHGALTSRSAVTRFSGCFAIVKTSAFLSPNAYRGNRHGVYVLITIPTS